jgi:creatinine amidohydrolase
VTRELIELTREELAEIAGGAVLLLPFGAVEQHGPHLPFGTDLTAVDTISRRAAERVGRDVPVVRAPALPYGSSHHHLEVGGALSLTADAFAACARDLLRSAAASGFRRAFVLNGHGGNELLLRVAAAGSGLDVGGGSYWTLAALELEQMMPPAPVPGHAGRFETSLALALAAPETLTAPERRAWEPPAETPYWTEDPGWWRRIDGYTDNPADGGADEGAAFLDAIVGAVAAAIVDFHQATAAR